jgi:hypothetical protein
MHAYDAYICTHTHHTHSIHKTYTIQQEIHPQEEEEEAEEEEDEDDDDGFLCVDPIACCSGCRTLHRSGHRQIIDRAIDLSVCLPDLHP